jgi:hypothetical protein
MLMMLAEGVHRLLLCGEIPGTYRGQSLCDIELQQGISRAEPLARILEKQNSLQVSQVFVCLHIMGWEVLLFKDSVRDAVEPKGTTFPQHRRYPRGILPLDS